MPQKIAKAIIMAGGHGNRLFPATKAVSKQLLNVHNKPMIYYPLAVLMQMGIRDILIIINQFDAANFERLLGDGSHLGIRITYRFEEAPRGIANAFLIGEKFIGSDNVALILGDNIFCSTAAIEVASDNFDGGAATFGVRVDEPGEYGVAEIAPDGRVVSIEEKPQHPTSDIAVTGLYMYDSSVVDTARALKPSDRGELEITDINRAYLKQGRLSLHLLGGDMVWFDTGTASSMARAGNYIGSAETTSGRKIACLEEIALTREFISQSEFQGLVDAMPACEYRDYLIKCL